MMAEAHPLFATPGQQIALRLPSSAFFPEPPRAAHPLPCTGKTDVANESALRSARSCLDRRDGRIGGRRAESRPGQTGAKTVCRKLRILPSQPARSCQGPLSPHALSVSAKTLFQRFQFGLGADVLSGIDRQWKARRGETAGGKHRAVIVASAGAGAGAIGAQRASVTTCSRLRCEISPRPSSFRPLPA